MNPDTGTFHRVTEELLKEHPEANTWPKFDEGEVVILKGYKFRIHEIGHSRLVLKAVTYAK